MVSFSRRALLAASAAGGLLAGAAARVKAQTFGNPDLPPQGAINAQNPRSLVDPGPQTPVIAGSFPMPYRRPQPMSADCRRTGPRSTTPPSASRTAAGRAR
jgi:hypothetical protein